MYPSQRERDTQEQENETRDDYITRFNRWINQNGVRQRAGTGIL